MEGNGCYVQQEDSAVGLLWLFAIAAGVFEML